MESLKKLREPAALTALIVVAARLLNALVSAAIYAGHDGVSNVAGLIAYRAADATLIAVATALVASCVLADRTRHASALTIAGSIVVGAATLAGLSFALLMLGTPGDTFVVDTIELLFNLAVPVLCLILLIRLALLRPAGAVAGQPYAIQADGPGFDRPAIAVPEPQYQPTWQPDVAAGAAWQTAGEAAAGAPASGWGTPGQQGGWQPPQLPQPQQQDPPQQQPPAQQPYGAPPGAGQPGRPDQPPSWPQRP